MDFDEWLAIGERNGWVGVPVCYTHDGLPTSASEDEEFETGDPCISVMRVYESTDVKTDVEKNHAPSVWRKREFGLEGGASVT